MSQSIKLELPLEQNKLNIDNTEKVVPNPFKWGEMKENIETLRIDESIIYPYVAAMPPNGYWDGIFIQVIFLGPEGTSLIRTTKTLTIPKTFAVEPCSNEECYGTLA